MSKAILLTQCLQNDFVQPIGKYDRLPNSLHVGYSEAQRLLGERLEEGPVLTAMKWAYSTPAQDLELVHVRDWHDAEDERQKDHLDQFGPHCLRQTPGAAFVFQSAIDPRRPHRVIDSNGLNDFVGTDLEAILEPLCRERDVRIGIAGVWTEAKVFFLAYELKTRFPHVSIGLCSALCASSSRQMHFVAIDQMKKLLDVRVFASVGDFTTFLTGSLPEVHRVPSARLDAAKFRFVEAYNMKPDDETLVKYLFRECADVELKALDGGFSGNVVLKVKSHDAVGHQQVPSVVKIGPRSLIAQERMSFEKIQEVLGNNAPAIVDFAEIADRGAIKYRYAAMLEGPVTCFQDLYEGSVDESKIFTLFDRVFGQQLGRLYEAKTLERINLFAAYDFRSKYAPSVRANVRAILGDDYAEDFEIAPSLCVRDLERFYSVEVDALAASDAGSHYVSYCHGDLNGKNILVDSQGNVWIIDFFNCDRAHVLKDLAKLENDLLYIFTKIETEAEFEQACALTEVLADQHDLGVSLDADLESRWTSEKIRKAFRAVVRLRSFYPALVELDRSPDQLYVALLRYSAHTLGFDECTPLQKRWALFSTALYVQKIRHSRDRAGALAIDYLFEDQGDPAIGLTILPGRKDRGRNLEDDLKEIQAQKVNGVLCLLTENEFSTYGVEGLRSAYERVAIDACYVPIVDQGVPSPEQWKTAINWIDARVKERKRVMIHCVGGLGRSGLIAAGYLVEKLGYTPQDAIERVRQRRGRRAVESAEQERFLESLAR